jgi:hypothetical protein
MQISRTIGHVLVPKEGVTDIGARLGDADWERSFDVAAVTDTAWEQLDHAHLLDSFQRLATGIVGRSEEAWFEQPELLLPACKDAVDRAAPAASAFLLELMRLARVAQTRHSVVIFAIS